MYYGVIVYDGMVEYNREIIEAVSDIEACSIADNMAYEALIEIGEEDDDNEMFAQIYRLPYFKNLEEFENWSISDIQIAFDLV